MPYIVLNVFIVPHEQCMQSPLHNSITPKHVYHINTLPPQQSFAQHQLTTTVSLGAELQLGFCNLISATQAPAPSSGQFQRRRTTMQDLKKQGSCRTMDTFGISLEVCAARRNAIRILGTGGGVRLINRWTDWWTWARSEGRTDTSPIGWAPTITVFFLFEFFFLFL